jgi:K+-sensing histidine kinase KdpD
MPASQKRKMFWINIIFILLLVYVIVALVWWFISLEIQNKQILRLQQAASLLKVEAQPSAGGQSISNDALIEQYRRNLLKYAGEGMIFLLFILLGAGYVYRAVRRQWKNQQQQQHLMMAITHELKTPIAIAKLNLETMKKHSLDEEKRKRIIQMTLQEAERLERLTNNILLSSQLEGSKYKLMKERLNFSELVDRTINEFRLRFPGREWRASIGDLLFIDGDAMLLSLLVGNLLENADKYAPPGTPVACTLHREGHATILSVSDNGPGIPNEEQERIFEKFYRVGDESTRKTKGTGLGLYLCQKIANDHNGNIRVEPNLPNGSTFVVSFS